MNYNKTMLGGRLTRDPELRYTPHGTAVTDIGLAIGRKVKQGETWVEEVTFLDVTLWGRNAENVRKFLTKGSTIFVEGRLSVDSWDDKQSGKKHHKLKITADFVQFVGGKSEGGQRDEQEDKPAPTLEELGDDEIPF